MLLCLTNVSLMPCAKGPFFDRIQTKLHDMKHGKTNELMDSRCSGNDPNLFETCLVN